MLRFIVMRHAKSIPATVDLADHRRSLTTRGQSDATAVARSLATRDLVPERVLCSDSSRTRETWQGMADAFTTMPTVHYSRQLYLPSVADFEAVVSAEHGSVSLLLVIAHNPGCEELIGYLSDTRITMKTSFAAVLQADTDVWEQAFQPGAFSVVSLVTPPPREH